MAAKQAAKQAAEVIVPVAVEVPVEVKPKVETAAEVCARHRATEKQKVVAKQDVREPGPNHRRFVNGELK
jgi:hypothetical protein